jgi:glutathione S-transferase
MVELIQFPWSPFCIVQRRILEFAGKPFKIRNIPNSDRTYVWRLTRQRYYGVPVVKDGHEVVFETDNDSQVIAKYLDFKFGLGLFPWEYEGVQNVLWRDIEREIEDVGFRLNDIYWKEMLPQAEQPAFLRHKERKFGRGCLEQWTRERGAMLAQLAQRLVPYDEMLMSHEFLLDGRPRFVDFDLFGMLGNFLYSGHYRLPSAHKRLAKWYRQMEKIKFKDFTREKLRT